MTSVLSLALIFQTIRRLHDLARTGRWIAPAMVVEMTLALPGTRDAGASWAYATAAVFPWACLTLAAVWPASGGANRFGPPATAGPWIRRTPTP
ncbi:DUF805 domain-containing protein [Phenylobacterium sp. SCN 70-31]|uniref:DUF805 domain-containing protein n=1 Tax=Phenylobacterium sp. SCN 70-31 TaxID=1660129 RepID=UPI00086D4769|nr:DUF805 domain-containing protein [Phenylobacterium sp. SCN 70-31]ODT89427.1 MAG: hypothetical protein ABS78_04405 [Phenylobacterium sp. SCN 70-31]